MGAMNPVVKRFRSRLRAFVGRDNTAWSRGVPASLEERLLRDIVRRHAGSELQSAFYEHLSGWKEKGAFRLKLKTANGRELRLIYKDAVYDLQQIPALARLPVAPGPPEFAVYTAASAALQEYLPHAYLCEEVEPGRRYRYVFQDLDETYREIETPDDIVRVAGDLGSFHAALSKSASRLFGQRLLDYDGPFYRSIHAYVDENLDRYRSQFPGKLLDEIRMAWPGIQQHLNDGALELPGKYRPIHGDLNVSNVLVGRHSPRSFKVIDWEWAGWGLPQADAAALLKKTPPDVEKRGFDAFVEGNSEFSPDEHRRLYLRCQLERGLLDAAFLAVQASEKTGPSRVNMPRHIERSLAWVLKTYHELDEGH
jgi:thiamine kinase-like enzyme